MIKSLPNVPILSMFGVTYNDRPRSDIVISLLKASGISRKEAAMFLGTTITYFNNKILRNSFSFDDIVRIAYLCGYIVTFKYYGIDNERNKTYQINTHDFMDKSCIERLEKTERINQLKCKIGDLEKELSELIDDE